MLDEELEPHDDGLPSDTAVTKDSRPNWLHRQVKVPRHPVVQRVVINKEQLLNKEKLDATVQQKTEGLHSNSYDKSPKKQTLKDIKVMRTHEWCCSLNDQSMQIKQNGLLSGQSSNHQSTKNGISLSDSETLTQPSLLRKVFNSPKESCRSHEGKPSSAQSKCLQNLNSEAEDVKYTSSSPIKGTQSANVFSRLGPQTMEGLAHYSVIKKRKNIGNNHEHGGKMRVSSSPNEVLDSDPLNIEIFWRSDLPPKGFCFIQLQHGSCRRNDCKFKHISMEDVKEVRFII